MRIARPTHLMVAPLQQAAARASGPARAGAVVLGAAVLGGAAYLGTRLLTPAPAGRVETPRPTAAASADPGNGISQTYLQLSKTAPAAAAAGSDPAAFRALLTADGPGWAAADGTISVPLADGRTLWLFGDTIVDLPGADGTLRRNADFVRNSAVLQNGATATTLLTGTTADAGDFLVPEDPTEWYWPGHGIQQGDDVLLFMGRVRKTLQGEPGWNFEGTGSDLIRLDARDLSVKERIAMPGTPDTAWGTAIQSDDTHTYVFGFQGTGLERNAMLARAPKGELGDAPFEFWDGSGWTADGDRAAPITDGVSNSYSVTRTPQGRWAMVSQQLYFGTELQVRTADSPQGPWGAWRTIDPGPTLPQDTISYNAQVHPSFSADGSLLASWNLNRNDGRLPGPDELDDYRPIFDRVRAELLDEPSR